MKCTEMHGSKGKSCIRKEKEVKYMKLMQNEEKGEASEMRWSEGETKEVPDWVDLF